MTPAHQILVGDCLELLRAMPDCSVHCCITSPPYYGLRDYGVDGQIGLEGSPAEFISRLVDVFREVRRVLRDDGTCWVNMGDSYASIAGGYAPEGSAGKHDVVSKATRGAVRRGQRRNPPDGLKQKDLIGIPWRLAFALQDDGWYLRQDIIWHKPNPMPESVRDRCTKAHEYLFLLSKSPKYFFDSEVIKETAVSNKPAGNKRHKYADAYASSDSEEHRTKAGLLALAGIEWEKRNRRSVWTVATSPFKGAHFATFPPDLIRPCVLAGAPRDGLILDPFGGAGTTGLVAMQEGRRSVLLELNPEYAEIAQRRLHSAWLSGDAQTDLFLDEHEAIASNWS